MRGGQGSGRGRRGVGSLDGREAVAVTTPLLMLPRAPRLSAGVAVVPDPPTVAALPVLVAGAWPPHPTSQSEATTNTS